MIAWVVLAALAGTPDAGSPYKTPPKKSRVVIFDRVSLEQLEALLSSRGLVFDTLRRPGASTALRFELDGVRVLLLLDDQGGGEARTLRLYVGFAMDAALDPSVVNRWNQGASFTRAYVDAEGDPVLESDLDLRGGVTIATLAGFLDTFTEAVPAFVRHLQGR